MTFAAKVGSRTLPATSLAHSVSPRLQRKCACGGRSSPGGTCGCEQEDARLQRRGEGPYEDSAAPPWVREVLASPGQPLPRSERRFFEQRFGHDFSRVRVHTDARAQASAHSVGAAAYTVGHHIVLGDQSRHDTAAELRPLAHELAHVVQQERGTSGAALANAGRFEQAAEAAAAAFVAGEPIHVGAGSAYGLARQPSLASLGLDVREPRSLTVSLDASGLDTSALELEIGLIHEWLDAHFDDNRARDLELALVTLEAEQERRRGRARKREERLRALSDEALEKKIAHFQRWLKEKPASGPDDSRARKLARHLGERNRRRDIRRARTITGPRTVAEAVAMFEEAWRDAEKEDPPDLQHSLRLVSSVHEWLQLVTTPESYYRHFRRLALGPDVAMMTVGPAKTEVGLIRHALTHGGAIGGHWPKALTTLQAAKEHLEIMAGERSLESTSIYGTHQAAKRAMKYHLAIYGGAVAAPAVVAGAVEAAPALLTGARFLGTQATGAYVRTTTAMGAGAVAAAPKVADALNRFLYSRPALWTARNIEPVIDVGTAAGSAIGQVAEQGKLDLVQLAFDVVQIWATHGGSRGRAPAGTIEPDLPPATAAPAPPTPRPVVGATEPTGEGADVIPIEGAGGKAAAALPPEMESQAQQRPLAATGTGDVAPTATIVGGATEPQIGIESPVASAGGQPPVVTAPAIGKALPSTTQGTGATAGTPSANVGVGQGALSTGVISPRTITAPGRHATLPLRTHTGQKFKSAYRLRPQWRDAEATVRRSLDAATPGWIRKRFKQPTGGQLLSTEPEYFHPTLVVAAEVKDVQLSDLSSKKYAEWAIQLQRRNHAMSQSVTGPVEHWFFLDLRGSVVEVNLAAQAAHIKQGIAEAGRVGNTPGATYEKVFFILDEEIVEVP